MYENNFENVDGAQLALLPVGFDCSAFIDTNRKTMVAEGVVTKMSKAINTSTQYYDTLKTKIIPEIYPTGKSNSDVTIIDFDKGQTIENIVNINRNILSIDCSISINQGELIKGINFGFIRLDTSYKVKDTISFTLEMAHGTITGTSGYFRLWLI